MQDRQDGHVRQSVLNPQSRRNFCSCYTKNGSVHLEHESQTHVYKLSHCSLCEFLQKRMQRLFLLYVFERDICQTGRSKEITLFMKHFGTWKSKLLQKLSEQTTKGCNLFWKGTNTSISREKVNLFRQNIGFPNRPSFRYGNFFIPRVEKTSKN
jgi:hypothetical protein